MKNRKTLCVLGNCVAQRLQNMLAASPEVSERYDVIPMPAIHAIPFTPHRNAILKGIAQKALSCDVIFTQPLFSFESCNTATLRANLSASQRLLTFSAPDFGAYFPDICWLKGKSDLHSQPVFEWDSRIFFACFVNNISIFNVEEIYLTHPMFTLKKMLATTASALERYRKRDQNVDIPTSEYVVRHYKTRRLFYSAMHPTDEVLQFIYARMLALLDMNLNFTPLTVHPESFDFNRWPVVMRQHHLFHFSAQEYFLVANEQQSIENIAMTYYIFYDAHPHIVEANRDLANGVL